ncbi:MAG: choice-of-anchor L domain-containing protein, partial [Chitinophagaceae bacterium]|nr:choice-of-anchor L domain-containing protein [Chitinophagaceae bacterium]
MKKTHHTNFGGGFIWGMLLVLVGLNFNLQAQVAVSNTNNPSTLAQKLSGPGVTVSNATILCENQQSGIFVATTPIFGLDSGIVLTTGRAGTLLPFYGVNGSEFNLANFNHGNGGDPQLTTLAGTTTHDRCILEFDFKANGDTVYFQYLFGSEEYPAYNCANYNDVFGFFISGPGYSTPLNLALIPNTNIPVSINSINNGVISAGGNISNCTSMGAGSPFTSMYNSNVGGTNLTYSGFTDLLTSKASITPCSTYHLKLAIADGFDNIIDSGVFLKAGSLTSNTFEIEVAADSVLNNQPYVHEGCDSAVIRIKRKFAQNSSFYPDTVNLIVSGTAITGIDYPAIATSFAFTANPNDTVRTVYIEAFNDLINEGTETIKLSIFDNCSTPSDSISFLV